MAKNDIPQRVKKLIDEIVDREGGYSNDPQDPGGATNHGITEAVARADGYTGAMSKLPKARAVKIYADKYFFGPKFDMIDGLSESIAERVVDAGVNIGTRRASQFLQRCLNIFNLDGSYYADILVDGIVGEKTRDALAEFLKRRGEEGEQVMVAALNALQGNHYIMLSETKPSNQKFTYGWFRGRILPFS